jgi:hypothetical protein
MKRADAVIVGALLAFGGFIATQAIRTKRQAPGAPTPVADADQTPAATSEHERVVASSGLPAPSRDIGAIRTFLTTHEQGTFVGEILAARDSLIARWIDRRDKPVTVWIDERSPLAGPDQALVSNVRRAFADWGQAGAPLVFTYVGDSAGAEVKVTFVDHFERRMSGLTLWTRDPNGWILGGNIELSLRSGSGRLLDNDQLYAIALHEVGHMLGLDHASDSTAIMAPRVSSLSLTPADVATMRLVYQVPPGSVKAR